MEVSEIIARNQQEVQAALMLSLRGRGDRCAGSATYGAGSAGDAGRWGTAPARAELGRR